MKNKFISLCLLGTLLAMPKIYVSAQETIYLTSQSGTEICSNANGKGDVTFKIAITDTWENYTYNFQEGADAEFSAVKTNEIITTNTLNKEIEPGTHYYRIAATNLVSLTSTVSQILSITAYSQMQTGLFDFDTDTIGIGYTTITATGESGSGNGELQYQWYESDAEDGEYTAIEGATSASYTTEKLTTTTYYKRSVYDGCNGIGEKFTKNSKGGDVVVVVVPLNLGEITWDDGTTDPIVICTEAPINKGISSKIPVTGASGKYGFGWQLFDESDNEIGFFQHLNHVDTVSAKEFEECDERLYHNPGTYKIARFARDQKNWQESRGVSNKLTFIIKDDAHQKNIELLKNDPIEAGDNIFISYNNEDGDSNRSMQWFVNDVESTTLTSQNLFKIAKDYTGELSFKLKTTTIESGCFAIDSIKLNVQKRKVDTVNIIQKEIDTIYTKDTITINTTDTITNEIEKIVYDTIYQNSNKIDTIYLNNNKIDTIYMTDTIYSIKTKTDTLYITDTVYVTDTIYLFKPSAIEEQKINASIYPNPTTQFITVNVDKEFSYQLFDLKGNIIKKENDNFSYTIDLSNYPDGTYLLKTSDGVTHKVVKK